MTQGLPRAHAQPWPLTRSTQLLARAQASIPGLTLSMMKRPEHFCPGRFPIYIDSGDGALVKDVDENEYIDLICGLGANSLGHRHLHLERAIETVRRRGVLHSLPTDLEVETVERLCSVIPGAEMGRLFKTGADATSAAVRLARAITGREKIVTIGYNGWHDHFMFDTEGVPAALTSLTERLPLFTVDNEGLVLDKVQSSDDSLAAVLLSVPYNRVISREFLERLRQMCTARGIVLIFDEIVTGFRLARAGIGELFGVSPDISCYSKAMAAGYPLSLVAGSRSVMETMQRLQVSTTFGGELGALAACLAVLDVYEQQDVPAHLAQLGRRLRDGVNQAAQQVGSPLRVVGYDAIPFFLFAPEPPKHAELMQVFQGHMAERGVLLRRDVNFLCAAHTSEQIDFVVRAALESLKEMHKS